MGKGKGRSGPSDYEKWMAEEKKKEEGPPKKTYIPKTQNGLGGLLAGAADERGNAPGFAAMMFAIFSGTVAAVVLIIGCGSNCKNIPHTPL